MKPFNQGVVDKKNLTAGEVARMPLTERTTSEASGFRSPTRTVRELREPGPPGGWSRAYVRLCIQLRGATVDQIIDAMAEQDFYANDVACATTMSQLVRRGYLTVTDRVPCKTCGHHRKVYHATEHGRRYAEVHA